jgi:hypothetical protein
MTRPRPDDGDCDDGVEKILGDLRKRFRGFPIPPKGVLDVAKASPALLAEFGVPPKPDRFRQPVQYRLWSTAFGRTLQFVKFAIEDEVIPDYRPFFRREGPSLTRFETSRNWSGASLDANADKTFVQIWGQWTVPTPQPPAGASLPPMGEEIDYQCACWIGLDGQRLYRNSSLPQIGTLQAVTVEPDGTQSFHTEAWTQWWDRGDTTSVPLRIKHFPVDHGDVISCVLTVLTPHSALLNIVNQSAKPFPRFAAILAIAPDVTLPGSATLQLSISGATAEWIMERPAIPGTDTLRPFPDYGGTDFVGCFAFEAFTGGVSPVAQFLVSPRFIRMYEVRGFPQRTAYISMPNRIDDASFNVAYGDFKN